MNELTQIPEQLMKFAAAKEQIAAIAEQCKNIVINSKESLDSAKTLAKDAKKIETLIEDKRKEITKPLLDEQRSIKAFADNLTSDLNTAVKGLRQQITDYEWEQEQIRQAELRRLEEERRKQEEEARKKAEELQKQMEESNEVSDAELVSLQSDLDKISELKAQQIQQQMEPKSNNLRMVWDFELVDIKLVPREFLVLDDAKVKAAIKLEVREIPGLKIFQKPQLNLR